MCEERIKELQELTLNLSHSHSETINNITELEERIEVLEEFNEQEVLTEIYTHELVEQAIIQSDIESVEFQELETSEDND
jgi:predicted phage-related endonuclease